jgi:hypothetical protein
MEKRITNKQALDINKCPVCYSTNISQKPSGCSCGIPRHSCWDHPVCNDCGYTAGAGAGNSNGGMWIEFSVPHSDTYEISTQSEV